MPPRPSHPAAPAPSASPAPPESSVTRSPGGVANDLVLALRQQFAADLTAAVAEEQKRADAVVIVAVAAERRRCVETILASSIGSESERKAFSALLLKE